MTFDVVVKGGRWFDGTGGPSALRHLGIRDGRVAAVSATPLDETGAQVVDATGRWVLPGMVDVHTHYDIEVLEEPALVESLRHGVTTVLVGSCSLSTVHVDPTTAGDLFGRVEAIPRRHVIDALRADGDLVVRPRVRRGAGRRCRSDPTSPPSSATPTSARPRWVSTGRRARTSRPPEAELVAMEGHLVEALDAGFVGMSAQELTFDKLDGEVCRSRTLPSTYARGRERRRLNALLRERGRVLQGGPDIKNPVSIARMTARLAARSAAPRQPQDQPALGSRHQGQPALVQIMGPIARTMNALGGDFRWQHLPVPFEVYADGIDLVIFEEFGSGAAALHLADQVERNALLQDEDYRRRFRKDYDAKFGMRVWHRDFFDAEIVECPDDGVVGKTFGQVGVERGGLHPVDAFLDLVVEHGTKLRWRTTISNHRPKYARQARPQPRRADRLLRRGRAPAQHGVLQLRAPVPPPGARRRARRAGRSCRSSTPCTGSPASSPSGTPSTPATSGSATAPTSSWSTRRTSTTSLDAYAESPLEAYDRLPRMVNRNDAAVTAVLVNGEHVFGDGQAADDLGSDAPAASCAPLTARAGVTGLAA